VASKIISFWQGVIKTLQFSNQVKTFAELEFFQEFMAFADRSLKVEEHIYRQFLMQQMEIKSGFNDYSMTIGKIKALNLVSSFTSKARDEFVIDVKQRIAILFNRLERIDVKLVEAIHS
jgi:hypothetical protein